ncbi:signal peptide peptidase-like 2A [Biomphalaria glabrata]|uniref:Signal peptide peptidase-like 2A n=1 Tax=Biomphalaria glabrata TaxID=6526 RepID=A0A9U8EMS8_BIOGL|nr:signal peptide peptidase-like 2A [Biomphalaria glabrata]
MAVLLLKGLLIFLSISKVYAAEDYSLLHVTLSESVQTYCIRLESHSQHLSETLEDAGPSRLVDLSRSTGCTLSDFSTNKNYFNSTVTLASGNCSPIQKAHLVQLLGGKGIIVDDRHHVATFDNSSVLENINITIATIGWMDFQQLISSFATPVWLKMYTPKTRSWDPNMFLIVILSTAFVMAGSGWAAYSERNSLEKKTPKGNSLDSNQKTSDSICLNVLGCSLYASWFVLPCLLIVLLYFFFNVMVFFFIGFFCIYGSYGLYHCLLPGWTHLVPWLYELPVNKLPCIQKKVQVRQIFLCLLCLALGIFWAIQRHSNYGWILQDLLGASLCITLVRDLKLPNLIIITVLLVFYLVYDVFFVFITPLITSKGDSIMNKIATGGSSDMESEAAKLSSNPKEYVPLCFFIPNFGEDLLSKCRGYYFSILGFGDLILPGILLTYNAVFDVKSGTKMVYYITSSIGYLCGMVSAMVAMVLMKTGQPALLYLIPCTLGTTLVVSLFRGEFKKIMKNSVPDNEEETTSEDQVELCRKEEEPEEIKDLNENDKELIICKRQK